MKKIIVLLLSLLLIIACVGCGTPKEIVKDKKFTAASYANYVTIKTRVEDMRTEFPDEWDEEQQRWEYHLTPIGTVVVEVEPIGSYKTEFTDCTLNVSFDAGNCYFVPHYVAKAIVDKAEYTGKNKTPREGLIDKSDRMIKDYCIPIKVNRLGDIISEL